MAQIKVQGDQQTTNVTAQRLQTQLHGKETDITLLMRAKDELEKLIKEAKAETLEAEKKSADYYQQLLRMTENFHVIQSENRILS